MLRKVYTNVYLFELNCAPLQIQKHNRELEIIVQECILNAVRDSIPVESILKAYMDETIEEDVVEEIKEQIIEPPPVVEKQAIFEEKQSIFEEKQANLEEGDGNLSLKFNDIDSVMNKNGKEELIEAPKTIERLEEISALRNLQRKMEEDEDSEKLNISSEEVSLDSLDVQLINPQEVKLNTDFLLDDIEVLA